ncbi:MAG: phosphodiester glycosidase family protein [Archangium sp.]|nr:phosphodiester glycosidase family protein [Archangium sp.]
MPTPISRLTTPVARTASQPTLSVGAKGPAVERLQRLLESAGHSPRGIDGEFGQNTRRAVLEFQRSAKLPTTGVANGATWTALEKKISAQKERAFLNGTKNVAGKLDALARQVDRFTDDGRVTSAERSALNKSISSARAAAEPMVADQSNLALAALEKVALMTKRGTLTTKAEDALKALRSAKANIVKDAKFDAHHSAFGPGFKRAFNGIATKDTTVNGLKAHVVAIDLADPRVKLQTNTESTRGRTVENHARAANAEVALNGDFFSWGSFKPSGLAITNGKQWSNTSSGFEGFLAFNGRHAAVTRPNSKNPSWSENAVSARPTVLLDGRAVLSDPAKNERSARSGIGISKDGRTLYLVAVQGRSGVNGLTATELGKFMRSLGADDAMAMDSGGSAQLYVRGRGMVQKSTDPGGSRGVANVVMVQSR